MRILRVIPVVILMAGLGAITAQAQNVALVLSNGYYEDARDVANISRQHNQLVAAFRDKGYDVVEGRDLNRLATRQRLNLFTSKLAQADIAVVALQGHVAHFGPRSWFLPVDIDANTVTDVEFRAVSIDYFTQLLAQKPGKSVMFVGDSGRAPTNVPGIEAGLGRAALPDGVMMVSGPYDKLNGLLKQRFLRRNTRVIDVLRGDIGRLEIEGDIPAALMLANEREARGPSAEDIENRLGLDRNERRGIQQDLTYLGYDTRGVDGVFGNGTRTAIREWQRHERFPATGYLTADQIRLLSQQGDRAREELQSNDRRFWAETGADGTERNLRRYLERHPNGLFANRARAELARLTSLTDEQAWARAVQLDSPDGYRQYLRDFPNGIYKDIARSRIGTPPAVVDNDAKRVEDALRLNPLTRLLIEQRVADLGFNTGPRDGNFDLATRQAFRAFQRDRGMEVTGYVTADMIRRLLLNQ